MTGIRFEPFFLDGIAGRLFCLLRAAPNADRTVLFVPPFAEEMNKSRKQVTITADRLVARGYATFVVDPYGTGDSEGDFKEARWDIWRSDLERAFSWLEENGLPVKALVASRLGCILAAEVLSDSARAIERSVFWQPMASGRQAITQFLRLRVAASMMSDDGKETVDELRQELSSGKILAVAGYELAPALAEAIDSADLAASLSDRLGALRLIEISTTGDGELSPVGRKLTAAAEANNVRICGERLAGEPFWTATEIVVNPALADATVRYIENGSP